MSFPEAIESGFSRYVDFSGRSSRSEYWWWVLFVFMGGILTILLGDLIGAASLFWLFQLAVFLPELAVAVRRLHDKDKSGWWILILFIPIIGAIVFLIWMVGRGDPNENRYGPNPLQP